MNCVLPKTPSQTMLRAATEYNMVCQLRGTTPSGKGYYEAMVDAHLNSKSEDNQNELPK